MKKKIVLFMFAVLAAGCGAAEDGGGRKYVFVTSSVFDPDFGGLSAGDALCANAAAAAELGGTSWRAWLSDSQTDAIDRIEDAGPWFLPEGTRVFNNKANLATAPLAAIDRDELGRAILEEGTLNPSPMTGTNAGGTRAAGAHCDDWTSYDWQLEMMVGSPGATDGDWTASSAIACFSAQPLYCIEQ